MSPTLRKSVLAAVGGGALAIASALITGPTGNDGLEGVRYDPYQDVVGVWTVCYGHTGKDIMLGKTYTEAECRALLNKDLNTVAWQINPYIKKPIPETMRGALYSFAYRLSPFPFLPTWCSAAFPARLRTMLKSESTSTSCWCSIPARPILSKPLATA